MHHNARGNRLADTLASESHELSQQRAELEHARAFPDRQSLRETRFAASKEEALTNSNGVYARLYKIMIYPTSSMDDTNNYES